MKKTLSVLVLTVMLVLTLGFVVAGKPECNGNPGSIWTTTESCGVDPQNANQYAIGQAVYLNGAGFCPGTYDWDITGQPGGASCDAGLIVASGTVTPNEDRSFCFLAYTIANDDCGTYQATVDKTKSDNYRVNLNLPVVPEFGTLVGILTALGALGVFFLVRRK